MSLDPLNCASPDWNAFTCSEPAAHSSEISFMALIDVFRMALIRSIDKYTEPAMTVPKVASSVDKEEHCKTTSNKPCDPAANNGRLAFKTALNLAKLSRCALLLLSHTCNDSSEAFWFKKCLYTTTQSAQRLPRKKCKSSRKAPSVRSAKTWSNNRRYS